MLEDRGLIPLGRLDGFFKIAIPLCTILGELHRREIIHGGISPNSILVSEQKAGVRLADFSQACRSSGEAATAAPFLGSELAYISPEQTGRMNRATDDRTDFYSLGATLYEVLTGAPPFRSADPLELIHSHIAKTPAAPTELVSGIPEPLSRIVMKLLAKTAEDRYQSALGLKHDLQICEREWAARGSIISFSLGQRDVSDRFLIPQKLYGRDREVGDLLAAFERTCDGATAMLLVSGYSGIGKSSLIQELYRPIVRQRGYFIAGKFDQVVRNIPYGPCSRRSGGLTPAGFPSRYLIRFRRTDTDLAGGFRCVGDGYPKRISRA